MKQILGLFVVASLCPIASFAQEAEPGGLFYTFDFSQLFEASSDRDLATIEEESGLASVTSLSFGVVSETRSERLSVGLGTSARISEGELSSDDINGRLAYGRNSADAIFDISLDTVRSDIAFLRDPSDFVDADGVLVLPDDFDDLRGTGIRGATTFSATIRRGITKPIGYQVSFSQQLLRYEDASASLADVDTRNVEFNLRLNANEVTTANINLGYSQIDEVGSPTEDRALLSGGLTFDRPLGEITAQISAARDDAGDLFWATSIERVLVLPTSRFGGSIGLVEDESGDARLTGRVDWSLVRPVSSVELNAIHSVSPGADVAITTLRANYLREITPISGMQIGFDFAQSSDPDGGDVLATGSLSASYSMSLTEIWDLSVGARANLREDEGVTNRSNTVFMVLDRPFSWRP